LSAAFSAKEHIRKEMETTLWGTKIHACLSKVYTREDVEKVIIAIQKEADLDENSKNLLSQIVKNVFSHPQADVLFREGATVKNEVELIAENGKTYRIDRLLLNGNNCILIDYKTGKQQDEHVEQINLYENLLQEAGYNVLEKWLVYVGNEQEVLFFEG
jgi:ATP-dependent exoDNAse (exonuclease V) beta subunit